MSIWLERFGDLDLPLIEAVQDIGAVGTRTSYQELPSGGAFDGYGASQAPRGLVTLRATGEIGNLTTQAAMLAEFDALRAMRGKRDKLYARVDDGTSRWVWARLRNIPQTRGMDNALYLVSELQFDITSPIWNGTRHGAGWRWNDGTLWNSGAAWNESSGDVFTLTHGTDDSSTIEQDGNAVVDNAVLTFTAGSAAITGFTLWSQSSSGRLLADFEYSGTIAATESLVIDAGKQSATISTVLASTAAAAATSLTVNSSASFVVGHSVDVYLSNGLIHRTTVATLPDSVTLTIDDPLPSAAAAGNTVALNAWADLDFGDNHMLDGWFRIAASPETTSVVVNVTSTQNATLTVAFNDGWQ